MARGLPQTQKGFFAEAGLAVEFVKDCGARVMVRGVRPITDIAAELTMMMANRRLGRLQGQYWRAAGAFDVKIAPLARPKGKARLSITWTRNGRWSDWAALSEGCYLLRTNLTDTDPAVLWKRYIQLTEAEWAFRITKDELEKVLLHRPGLRLPQRLRRIAEVARM